MLHKSTAAGFGGVSWIFGSVTVTQVSVCELQPEFWNVKSFLYQERTGLKCGGCFLFFCLTSAKWRWGFPLYRPPRGSVVICLKTLHKAVLWPFSRRSHFPTYNTCHRCLSGGGARSRHIVLFIADAIWKIFTLCVMNGGKSLWSFQMCVRGDCVFALRGGLS